MQKLKQTTRKRKNKQQKNEKGHPPAHHSTANEYLSGSGWMSCICLFFLEGFILFLCLLECVRLYMQKLEKTMQKQKEQQRKNKTKTKNKNKKRKKRKPSRKTKRIQLIQPEPERY